MAEDIRGRREVPEEEALRAQFYALLSQLLSAPPNAETLAELATLEGDDSEMGRALATLGAVSRGTTPADVEREYNALFIGLVRGELLPYGSFYQTGFLHEKPLAAVRADMERFGIARVPDNPEPEDHVATLCEVMFGLIAGGFGEIDDLESQRAFFDAHLRPWAGKFFEELEAAPSAAFYVPVAAIGRLFMAIEAEAFSMADAGARPLN